MLEQLNVVVVDDDDFNLFIIVITFIQLRHFTPNTGTSNRWLYTHKSSPSTYYQLSIHNILCTQHTALISHQLIEHT